MAINLRTYKVDQTKFEELAIFTHQGWLMKTKKYLGKRLDQDVIGKNTIMYCCSLCDEIIKGSSVAKGHKKEYHRIKNKSEIFVKYEVLSQV